MGAFTTLKCTNVQWNVNPNGTKPTIDPLTKWGSVMVNQEGIIFKFPSNHVTVEEK